MQTTKDEERAMNRFQALKKDRLGAPMFHRGLAITHCALCSYDKLYVDSDYYSKTSAEHDLLCAKCKQISEGCADLDTSPCVQVTFCNLPPKSSAWRLRESTWDFLYEILRADLKREETSFVVMEGTEEDPRMVFYGRKQQ